MPRNSKPSKPTVPTNSPPRFTNPMSSVSPLVPTQPSFGDTVKQGLAWGTGNAIAHRIFGPTVAIPLQTKIESPCEKERVAFESCMKTKSTEDFCGEEQMMYTRCLHPNG